MSLRGDSSQCSISDKVEFAFILFRLHELLEHSDFFGVSNLGATVVKIHRMPWHESDSAAPSADYFEQVIIC